MKIIKFSNNKNRSKHKGKHKNNHTCAGRASISAVLLACLLSAVMYTAAYAAEPGEVELKVVQVLTNTGSSASRNDTFVYQLIPDLESNPMPESKNTGSYTFSITGTDEANVGMIAFTHAGVYTYKIRHITSIKPGYTYDQEVYTLEFHVGSDLTVCTVICQENGYKAAKIKYEHIYKSTGGGTVSPPGGGTSTPGGATTGSGGSKPGSSGATTIPEGSKPTSEIKAPITESVAPPPGKTDNSENANILGSGKGVPKTGDEFKIVLYESMFYLAIIMALVSAVYLFTRRGRIEAH